MKIFQKVKSGGMSICVSCAHRKVCKGIDNQPCVECNQFFNEDKQPQTNADRIRAMSDEELADFLTHINPTNCQDCAFSVGWRCQPDRDDYSDFDKCKEGRKRWLKQPAE